MRSFRSKLLPVCVLCALGFVAWAGQSHAESWNGSESIRDGGRHIIDALVALRGGTEEQIAKEELEPMSIICYEIELTG